MTFRMFRYQLFTMTHALGQMSAEECAARLGDASAGMAPGSPVRQGIAFGTASLGNARSVRFDASVAGADGRADDARRSAPRERQMAAAGQAVDLRIQRGAGDVADHRHPGQGSREKAGFGVEILGATAERAVGMEL